MLEPQVSATKGRSAVLALALILAIIALGGVSILYVRVSFQYSTLQSSYNDLRSKITDLQATVSRITVTPTPTGLPPSTGVGLTSTQIFEAVEPSVVRISNRQNSASGIVTNASGSGFVYDTSGHIVTNNHVVEGADELRVTFLSGTIATAKQVWTDVYADLAVLTVDAPPSELHPVKMGDSSKLVVGQQVFAIGEPFGLSGSITEGIISQLGRDISTASGYLIVDVIQVDAAINPGNSGGPLLNDLGEVIGVNTAIVSSTGSFSGVGFAIPSNLVQKVIPALITNHQYKHPWVGVGGMDMSPDIAQAMGISQYKGFLITRVTPGSPAERAGLRAGTKMATIEGQQVPIGGDVVIKIDQVEVRGINDILTYIERNKEVGDTITMTILRGSTTITVNLTLAERPLP